MVPPPVDALCQISKVLATQLQRRCQLKLWTTTDDDGRTDGRRTDTYLSYIKLTFEPSAQVSSKDVYPCTPRFHYKSVAYGGIKYTDTDVILLESHKA